MASDEQDNAAQGFFSGRAPIFILGGLIVISLLAVCVLSVFLLRSLTGDDTAVSGEPTPFPTGPDGGSGVTSNEALVVGISGSDTVSVTLDIPVRLNVDGRDFGIQQQTINPDGTWSPGLSDESTAGWVFGSIVNYIVALDETNENRALLEGLAPGDQIVLGTQSGSQYTFEFDSRTVEPVSNQDVFAQYAPGMTLVLLGAGGDERLVVRGRYVVAESANETIRNVVELGEAAQLVDLQITVTGVTYVPDSPQAPPGFAFFLLDVQMQNTGVTAVDLGSLQLVLVDEIGNQYALNPVAAQSSGNPPLSGVLNPGQTLNGTVGYQVPTGLVSPALKWIVTIPGTDAQIQVNIPYTGATNVEDVVITLQSVTVSQDLTSMTLAGQVTNRSTQPLVITAGDVFLRTSDGATYLMLSSNPAFPWTVPPGGTLVYSVTFQRPLDADTAVFNVLNQPFELRGLR